MKYPEIPLCFIPNDFQQWISNQTNQIYKHLWSIIPTNAVSRMCDGQLTQLNYMNELIFDMIVDSINPSQTLEPVVSITDLYNTVNIVFVLKVYFATICQQLKMSNKSRQQMF